MRIGIDCRTILNPTSGEFAGVGHYTYNLVKHVIAEDRHNQYVLYFDYRTRDTSEFARENVSVKYFPFSQYGRYLPFGYSHMLISAYLLKEGLSLYHVPAGNVPFVYPKKVVYTVHDLAIYKNPGWFPSQMMSRHFMTPQSLRAANHIIAVSESTKKDLKALFNIKDSKISVIYEAADIESIPLKRKKIETLEKFRLPKKYLLYIGTIEPRKNIITLLRAYKRMVTKEPSLANVPLVIAGHKGYKSDMVFNELRELKLQPAQVKYLGYVTHNEKIELLRHATLFVFPSLYEGFGIPVLEAMALGVPVITSNLSALPEVTGKAAWLVSPEDDAALAAAMREGLLNTTKRKQIARRGKEQAKKFSWAAAARETIAVYHKIGKQ